MTDEAKGHAQLLEELDDLRRAKEALRGQVEDLRRQMARDLRRSHSEWCGLLEAIAEPTFILDPEYTVTFANRAACEALGRPEGELVGRKCHELFHGTTVPPESCPLAEVLRTGAPGSCEHTMGVLGGTFRVSCTPLWDESGLISRIVHVATDVTDQRFAQRALRDSEERLLDFFENAAIGFHIFGPDRVITDINQTELDLLGYRREEVVGRKTWSDLIVPEQREQFERHWRALLDVGEVRNLEYTVARKDGGKVHVLLNASARFDDKGHLVGTRGSVQDITERRRAEEALRASERNYRTIFDAANDGIILHNADDGIILDANRRACEIFGYDLEEMRGLCIMDISAGPEWEVVPEIRRLMDATAVAPQMTEWLCKHEDGHSFWVEVNLRRAMIGEQEVVLAVVRDITERKLAEQERRKLDAQVRHAQKLESLGVLAGGIAHDFNNLLMAILGNADVALMDLSSVSPARPGLEEIKRASIRASELTQQLLAYSGKGRFVVQPFDLNEMIREMGQLLHVSISKKAVLQYDLQRDLPAIEGDVAQIRQVVMNLITNASEAIGDETGVIAIRTETVHADRNYLADTYVAGDLPEGLYVSLTVTDTGEGMDEEVRAKLFDPFFTTKFTGRGLGLAAVLGIVRGHDGAVRVDSEVSKGTTFQILLPASDAHLAGAGAVEAGRTSAPWRGSGTVLVVDDEEAVRNVARAMLERKGFTVLTADDGVEGVEVFKRHADRIVAVLLDMTMPRMNGREAFGELRKIRDDVPVILSSGYSEQDAICRFGEEGLAGFVQKPYQLDRLVASLREALER